MMPPTVADVDRITALNDPVLRNLQITQCYFDLSSHVAQHIGGDANWCTFATWASKQAGQSIRKQDLGQALKRALTQSHAINDLAAAAAPTVSDAKIAGTAQPELTLWELLDPTAPFDRVSDAVARGNRKVFAEIGWVFAAFAADCLDGTNYDKARITAFCATLRPGPPPDGQDYLRQAFASYYEVRFVTEPKVRAEKLLFANIAIGLHEQTRLQPEIVEALDAPVLDPRDVVNRLAGLSPTTSRLSAGWRALQRRLGRPLRIDRAAEQFVVQAREFAHEIVTDHLMTLALPNGSYLRLGSDLVAPYPATLEHIVDPALRALLTVVDPTPDSLSGSGAIDWGNLAQRLHFIVDLFRCYQETPLLLGPPFTAAQMVALHEGRLPTGEL